MGFRLSQLKSLCMGGYLKAYLILNRIFNFLLFLLLLLPSLPLFLIISLFIIVEDRGPIFYKGLRLGRNKKPFIMYKFRTLIPDADKILGDEMLRKQISSKYQLSTGIGKFLRDTRLDELPQLLNILKGEMDFVGPRPERPEIYEKICKKIKGYDKRFIVNPGLIGYSQLFTPHSTPKRIRTLIDNAYINIKQNIFWDIGIISFSFFILTKKLLQKIVYLLQNDLLKSKILSLYQEKRSFERIPLKRAKFYIPSQSDDGKDFFAEAKLVNINEEAISVYLNDTIDFQDDFLFKLEIQYYHRRQKRVKKKNALCIGKISHKTERKEKPFRYQYVVKYTPLSSLNYYIIQKYYLRVSIS